MYCHADCTADLGEFHNQGSFFARTPLPITVPARGWVGRGWGVGTGCVGRGEGGRGTGKG